MLRNAARFAPLRLARHTQFLPRKSTVKWKSWSILYVFVGQDSTFLRKDELKSGQPVCKFNFYSAKQSTIHPVLQIRWPFCGTRSQYPHASEFQKLNWKLSIKSDTFWEDNCYFVLNSSKVELKIVNQKQHILMGQFLLCTSKWIVECCHLKNWKIHICKIT